MKNIVNSTIIKLLSSNLSMHELDKMLKLLKKMAANNILPEIREQQLIKLVPTVSNSELEISFKIWNFIQNNSVLSSLTDVIEIFKAKLENKVSSPYYLAYTAIFEPQVFSSTITIFSGGTGSNSLTLGILNKSSKFGNVNLLINAYDDGKSTGDIRYKLDTLGPSDIAKNITIMASTVNPQIQELLNYRFSQNTYISHDILKTILEDQHIVLCPILLKLAKKQQQAIKLWISTFIKKMQEWEVVKSKQWNLRDYALRNILYIGAYYNNQEDHRKTIEYMQSVFNLRGKIILNSYESMYLVGITDTNHLLNTEEAIVNDFLEENIKEIYLLTKEQKSLFDQFNELDKIQFIRNVPTLSSEEKIELTTIKSIDNKIAYLKQKGVHPLVSREALESIRNANLVCFAPTTIFSSLIPTLNTYGICDEIQQLNAPIVFIGNIGRERGEGDLSDLMHIILNHISFTSHTNRKYIIVSDHGYTNVAYQYAGNELQYLPVDLHKLRTLGLEPIQIHAQSPNGTHDSELIANILSSLLKLNQSGLKILQGRIIPKLSEQKEETDVNLRSQLIELTTKPTLYNEYETQIEKICCQLLNCSTLQQYYSAETTKQKNKVIILAAGHSERLKYRPKALYPIGAQPNLEYLLDLVAPYDAVPIVIINPLDKEIFDKWLISWRNKSGKTITLLEAIAHGTGGTLLNVKEQITIIMEQEAKDNIVLMWSDISNISATSLLKTIMLHKASKSALTIPTCWEQNPYAGPLRNINGYVQSFFMTQENKFTTFPKFGEHDGSFFIISSEDLWQSLEKVRDKNIDNNQYIKFEHIIPQMVMAEKQVIGIALLNVNEALGFNSPEEAQKVWEIKQKFASRNHFATAIQKPYYGLMIDVNSILIDQNIVPDDIVAFILQTAKQGIPIGIVTDNTTETLTKILLEKLENLKNIFIYSDSGALGFYLNDPTKEFFSFPIPEDISLKTISILKHLLRTNDKYDRTTHKIQIYSTRIKNVEQQESLITSINSLLETNMLPLKSYVSSTVNHDTFIMVTIANKGNALSHFLKSNNLHIDQVAKVAAEGRKFSTDHALLVGEGAFSVGTYDKESKQIPMYYEIGTIGIDATRFILQKLKLLTL